MNQAWAQTSRDLSTVRSISLIVGAVLFAVAASVANAEMSFRGLGFLAGNNYSFAYDVSADGTVVVGEAGTTNYGNEAFRWTAANGMVGLGDLPGATFYSVAFGVSADGSVVTGLATGA